MKIDIFIYGDFFLLISVISSFIWKKAFLKKKVISSDSIVLITGGSMGLGRELAVTLASRHKYHIIVYDIRVDLSDNWQKLANRANMAKQRKNGQTGQIWSTKQILIIQCRFKQS